MKLLILLTLLTSLIYAQEPKSVVPKQTEKSSNGRDFTDEETYHLAFTISQINLINKNYKIDDYHNEIDPVIADQQAMVAKACESVGVPKDKIKTPECGVSGFGPDGKLLKGPEGRPVTPHVWWNKPPTPEKK